MPLLGYAILLVRPKGVESHQILRNDSETLRLFGRAFTVL